MDPIQALVNQQQAAAQQQTAMQQKVQQLMQQKLQEKLGSMAPEKQQLYSNMLGVPVGQHAQEQRLDELRTWLVFNPHKQMNSTTTHK